MDASRRKYRPKLKQLLGRPDITPLVDVLFLLLIFFMLSSSFVQVSGIRIDLPRVDGAGAADIEKFIISIANSENGPLLYFNDMPVSWERLEERFAGIGAASPGSSVVIRADRTISIEVFARVAALAEKARLETFVAIVPTQAEQAVFGQER